MPFLSILNLSPVLTFLTTVVHCNLSNIILTFLLENLIRECMWSYFTVGRSCLSASAFKDLMNTPCVHQIHERREGLMALSPFNFVFLYIQYREINIPNPVPSIVLLEFF